MGVSRARSPAEVADDHPAFAAAPALDRPLAAGWVPRLAACWLRSAGWTVRLAQPVPAHCVAIFYPHTSNWDTVIGLLAKWVIGVRFHFIGKDTLFRWPLRPLLVHLGGIPVNRREPAGFVARIEEEFERRGEFRLALAPEGTRSRTEYWKSGFYRIARAVRVPVALAYIDFPRREIGVGAYLDLTGDAAADMARIRGFYAGRIGRHPGNQGPIRLHDE
jgi:1-acyl-sn-glycerol-3-phosphate acyltransferase